MCLVWKSEEQQRFGGCSKSSTSGGRNLYARYGLAQSSACGAAGLATHLTTPVCPVARTQTIILQIVYPTSAGTCTRDFRPKKKIFEFAHKKFWGEKFNSLERKWGVIYEFLIKNDRDIACQSFGVGRFFLQLLPYLEYTGHGTFSSSERP